MKSFYQSPPAQYHPGGPCTCGVGPWPNGDYCDNCGGSLRAAGAGARVRTHLVHHCALCGAIITRTGRGRPPKHCERCAQGVKVVQARTASCSSCGAVMDLTGRRGRAPSLCPKCRGAS